MGFHNFAKNELLWLYNALYKCCDERGDFSFHECGLHNIQRFISHHSPPEVSSFCYEYLLKGSDKSLYFVLHDNLQNCDIKFLEDLCKKTFSCFLGQSLHQLNKKIDKQLLKELSKSHKSEIRKLYLIFKLFPLDVLKTAVDFVSYSMENKWLNFDEVVNSFKPDHEYEAFATAALIFRELLNR